MKLSKIVFQNLQDLLQESENMSKVIQESLELYDSRTQAERLQYWQGKAAGLRQAIAEIEYCNS